MLAKHSLPSPRKDGTNLFNILVCLLKFVIAYLISFFYLSSNQWPSLANITSEQSQKILPSCDQLFTFVGFILSGIYSDALQFKPKAAHFSFSLVYKQRRSSRMDSLH